jgi:hypothetical protein
MIPVTKQLGFPNGTLAKGPKGPSSERGETITITTTTTSTKQLGFPNGTLAKGPSSK